MSFFKQNWLKEFSKLQYASKSHNLNKAVVASYYNVAKYGFQEYKWGFSIKQTKRTVNFHTNPDILFDDGNPNSFNISEQAVYKNKEKEVCYKLDDICNNYSSALGRGIKFSSRPEVKIFDYAYGMSVHTIYEAWKKTKEEDPKTFLMTFNPARYLRSYELVEQGFDIYQKLITIKDTGYALINFAKQGDMAFELSFLSDFKNQDLKLINDQNDCIIINCLCDLYRNHGIKTVNLGTDAGIKGLKFFKRKMPHFEQIVYRQ